MPRLRDHIGDKVTYRPPLSAQKQGALNRIGEIIDEVWAIDRNVILLSTSTTTLTAGGTTNSVPS